VRSARRRAPANRQLGLFQPLKLRLLFKINHRYQKINKIKSFLLQKGTQQIIGLLAK
jgi:hypothetical protein